MAEAYFNKYAPEGWKATSAGVQPAENVNPNAVRLMHEEGIDISHKKPQFLTKTIQAEADIAIIVCGDSQCPIIRAKHVERWDVPDPAKMPLEDARKIRDTIKSKVLSLIEKLTERH